jgi:tRNA-dihydrouridine synthase
LAVYPGLAGQKFQKDNLDKIRRLKENCSSVKIEVDGGIDKHNVQKVAEAGADIVSAATAIFSASDIGKAIEELKGTTESAEEFLPPETKRKKLCPHLLLPKKISIAALIFVILAALVIINLYLQFLNLKF